MSTCNYCNTECNRRLWFYKGTEICKPCLLVQTNTPVCEVCNKRQNIEKIGSCFRCFAESHGEKPTMENISRLLNQQQ